LAGPSGTTVLLLGDDPPEPPEELLLGDDPPEPPEELLLGNDPPEPTGEPPSPETLILVRSAWLTVTSSNSETA